MAKSLKTPSSKTPRLRADGRRTFLVYMEAALIKEVKKAALEDDVNAYEIVEAATREWVARRARKTRVKS